MGPEDKVEITSIITDENQAIPGLDLDGTVVNEEKPKPKKVPFSKPIPRNFQAQWNETGGMNNFVGSFSLRILFYFDFQTILPGRSMKLSARLWKIHPGWFHCKRLLLMPLLFTAN